MNQLTGVTRAQGGERALEDWGGGRGDTSEEAVNINETTTESVEENEPAENAENTEKLVNKIMVSEISIFTVAVENLQFNCDQCNKTNSSDKGLTQYMWSSDITILIIAVTIIKKIPERQEKVRRR